MERIWKKSYLAKSVETWESAFALRTDGVGDNFWEPAFVRMVFM